MPEDEVMKSIRYRINISRGMKGGTSFEATTDMTGYSIEEVLEKSDELVERLERRYPIKMAEGG